ncbi:MAG TPA: ABC transporter substrate-binding protein [Thermoanaerobaculia bacterium]
MRPTSGTLAGFATAAALGLLATGCIDTSIKVGAVLPLTGVDQVYGEAIHKGVQLAYDEIGKDRSRETPIELTVVDSESVPETAKERLDEVYGNGALAVIGGVTPDEATAMIAVADSYDRVLLSPSASSPALTGVSRNFYRIWPSDYSAANRMASFASDTLALETVVVIVERAFGQGIQGVFQEAFEGAGGKVLESIELPELRDPKGKHRDFTGDFRGIVEAVMSLDPDGVYLAAFAKATSAAILELRKQGYEGQILTTSAFTTSAIADTGQAAEGVVLTQIFFELDSEHAHVRKFVEGFEKKYGEMPDLYAAHGYDAMLVMATAVEGRPALAGEVHKGLRDAVKEFPGVTGSIQFDERGDVQKFPRVYVIGEDLDLFDYNERVQRQKDELRRKREELRRRLEQIQREAGNGG